MKLFCGHEVPDADYAKMFALKRVRCPIDGVEWRGYMVIGRDKSLAKKELARELRFENDRKKRSGKER